jgi:ABC-type multidrug transport system fused ATPase/permease subunit
MMIGLVLNILGMVGEFSSPWFIGKVIDAITESDFERVTTLTIWWMIFNSVCFKSISNYFRSEPFLVVYNGTFSSLQQNLSGSN